MTPSLWKGGRCEERYRNLAFHDDLGILDTNGKEANSSLVPHRRYISGLSKLEVEFEINFRMEDCNTFGSSESAIAILCSK